jgi:peptide/nickel transport system substrate-binding protein
VLYHQATARMCEEAPVLFLFNQPVTYATSNRVRWQARGDDWVRAWDFMPR